MKEHHEWAKIYWNNPTMSIEELVKQVQKEAYEQGRQDEGDSQAELNAGEDL